MKSKKSQTEILGLAIVVVLVILGLALYFRFSFVLGQDNDLEIVTDSVLAENIIGSMLKTNTGCIQGQDFKGLIISCSENHNMPGFAYTCSNGAWYCDFLKDKVEEILNSSLRAIEKNDYSFSVKYEMNQAEVIDINQFGDSCQERETAIYPLPTSLGNILVRLSICR